MCRSRAQSLAIECTERSPYYCQTPGKHHPCLSLSIGTHAPQQSHRPAPLCTKIARARTHTDLSVAWTVPRAAADPRRIAQRFFTRTKMSHAAWWSHTGGKKQQKAFCFHDFSRNKPPALSCRSYTKDVRLSRLFGLTHRC